MTLLHALEILFLYSSFHHALTAVYHKLVIRSYNICLDSNSGTYLNPSYNIINFTNGIAS